MTTQKERHQTWGPVKSPTDQLRAELGLTAPPAKSGFKFRREPPKVNTAAIMAAFAARAAQDLAADRHKRWGDAHEVDLVPDGPSTDLVILPDEEIERVRRINVDRAARLLPWQAGAATAVAGTLAWGAGEAAALTASGEAGQVFVAGCAACVVAAAGVVNRRRRDDDGSRPFRPGGRLHRWRLRHRAAWLSAAAWVAAAGVSGPSWELVAALLLGGAAVSAGYVRAHEVVLPPEEPLELPEAPDPYAEFAARWAEKVACPGGQVPGSLLDAGRVTAEGVEFLLVLPSGWTVTTVHNRLDAIASALGCDPRQLVVEHVAPDARGWVDASRARLQYLRTSPIIGTVEVEHTGPRSSTPGRIGIGPYIDGSGEAEVVLADGESVWSTFICGATGSGKTELATALVADGRATLPIVSVYFDGKRSSSPDLAAAATVKALGVDHAELFTRCVETLLAGLQERAAATGEDSFQWGPGRPIYWFILDEVDMLWAIKGMALRWRIIAKTVRSLGGAVLAMSQGGDLKVFGNDDILRASVCRNVVVMNIPTGSTGSLVAPGLPAASAIPMGGGYAHLQAEGSRPRELLRGRRLRSSRACGREGLDPDTAWGARRALREAPDASLCEVGRAAFAPLLDPPTAGYEGGDVTSSDAPSDEAKARTRAAWGQAPAAVAPESAPDRPETPEPALSRVTAPEPVVPAGLTTNQSAVWAAVAPHAGGVAFAAVVEASGKRKDAVSRALASMEQKGLVRRVQRGVWAPTDRPRTAAAPSS